MNKVITIRKLVSTEKDFISKIADWYQKEWDTPINTTVQRLTHPSDDDVLFQLVLTMENQLIATGGVRRQVNILNIHPELREWSPWAALLYTDKNYRGRGLGEMLLKQLETSARELQLAKLYLYTFTAEKLYRRCGWKVIDEVDYKNQRTVIMEKELAII